MEKKKKEVIIISRPGVFDNVPKEEMKEINESLDGLKEALERGEMPGEGVVLIAKRLPCGTCGSKDIMWMQGKKSKEVSYNCIDCNKSSWMTYEEYEAALEKHKDDVYEIQVYAGTCRCGEGLDMQIADEPPEEEDDPHIWIVYGNCVKEKKIFVQGLFTEKEPIDGFDFMIDWDKVIEESKNTNESLKRNK